MTAGSGCDWSVDQEDRAMSLSATLSSVGSFAGSLLFFQTLEAALSMVGAISRRVGVRLAGSQTFTGTIRRAVSAVLSGFCWTLLEQ